ncbi:MAG: hypothetical protein JWR09_5597 [Mucilaginibacter sp.]|nr:hypothetical protein [Mucilaginibacter sp.]
MPNLFRQPTGQVARHDVHFAGDALKQVQHDIGILKVL